MRNWLCDVLSQLVQRIYVNDLLFFNQYVNAGKKLACRELQWQNVTRQEDHNKCDQIQEKSRNQISLL